MRNIFITKSRKGSSMLVFALGSITMLIFVSLVVDIGIILNTQSEMQKAVESSVLVGASNFEPKKIGDGIEIVSNDAKTIAKSVFDKYIANEQYISSANITALDTKAQSKAIRIKTVVSVPTYFLKIVGVNTVNIISQAAAISVPFYLKDNLAGGARLLNASTTDTQLRDPVGENINVNKNLANLYGPPDGKSVNLGPGGYITIKLPIPLFDGAGADLYIKQTGNIKGYYVFAGMDKDPANPAAGIIWENISCTGRSMSVDPSNNIGGIYSVVPVGSSSASEEARFYGSGYFSLGAVCKKGGTITYNGTGKGQVRNATYLKIIDDNVEDGYLANYPNRPVTLQGDHASITPGASIDAIAVLHHTRLISVKEFDENGTGTLFPTLRQILNISGTGSDTDGDTISDVAEYSGWYGTGTSIIDNNSGTNKVHFTNPKVKDAEGLLKITYD